MAANDSMYGDDLMQYDFGRTAVITPEQARAAAVTVTTIAIRRNALPDLSQVLDALGLTGPAPLALAGRSTR